MNSTRPRRSSRGGFTLAEVLVVLAITAILAATVLPVLIKQFRKGDIGRVISDLTSIQTGIETFVADVRRIPGSVRDLVAVITTSTTTHSDVYGAGYPSGLVTRWSGPYITNDTIPGGYFATGFAGQIKPRLTISSGDSMVLLSITGFTDQEFNEIDLELDGVVNTSAGRFRYLSATDSATYRLMPAGG